MQNNSNTILRGGAMLGVFDREIIDKRRRVPTRAFGGRTPLAD